MKALPAARTLLCLALLALPAFSAHAWERQLSVKNSFTALGALYAADELPDAQASLAWKPELFGELFPGGDFRLSAELSADSRLKLVFGPGAEQDLDFSLYRAWAAASWRDTELKGGLQHIRMGVAQIYRPLQWFDQLAPASLLQETEGVEALTLSHFFPNPELRLWLLPSSGEAKGTELLPSRDGAWEFGGRLSCLNPLGESGLSYHQRQLSSPLTASPVNEYRFGFDQRVDGFMGGWLEAALSHLDSDILLPAPAAIPTNSLSATLGGDYTLGWGNGLYLLLEQNVQAGGGRLVQLEDARVQGALLLSYPLGLLDGIQLLISYDYMENRGLGTLAWRRTYDYLSWELSASLDSGYPARLSRAPSVNLTINYDI